MHLDAVLWQRAVPEGHHFARRRPRGYLEAARHRRRLDDKRVVPHGAKGARQARKELAAGVGDVGEPAVHRLRSKTDRRAHRQRQALVAEAHAEEWQACVVGLAADAKVGSIRWTTWPRRYDHCCKGRER